MPTIAIGGSALLEPGGPPLTVGGLIELALKDSGVTGVGQTPLNEDINDAFVRLNMMIAQWRRKRWLVTQLLDLPILSTGAQSYTVGPSQDIDTPFVPDKLEDAYFRNKLVTGNQPDYPLRILQSREDYSRLVLKELTAFPQCIYYDREDGYTTGRIFPWPVPQASIYEIHVVIKAPLNSFVNVKDTVNMPLEYRAAVFYNLCVRLRLAYRLAADEVMIGLAKDSLNTVREANTQIPSLRMPSNLVSSGRYDVYSDRP